MRRIVASGLALAFLFAGWAAVSTAGAGGKKDDKTTAGKKDDKATGGKTDGGWVQLFNGKDLKGWKTHPDNPGKWRVEKGILVSSGTATSHLFSERDDYENFHYRIEAKISDKGNSGQYFRTAFGPKYPKGYEAQINSTFPSDPQRTGSLYNFVKITEMLVPADTWFTQEVIAVGNHIQILVNGKKVVDFKDEKNTHTKGHFALQQHGPAKDGPESVLQVKKIEVKELPATVAKKDDVKKDDKKVEVKKDDKKDDKKVEVKKDDKKVEVKKDDKKDDKKVEVKKDDKKVEVKKDDKKDDKKVEVKKDDKKVEVKKTPPKIATTEEYYALANKAFKDRQVIVVLVGVERPELDAELTGFVVVRVKSFPDVAKTGIVVGLPSATWLTRIDLPADASARQIRGLTGRPPLLPRLRP